MTTELTNKEKNLVMLIVKRASKETIEKQLKDLIEWDVDDNIVYEMAKFLGYDVPKDYSIQYLNYANEYYEKIQKLDFSEPIERVVHASVTMVATERETVYVNYDVNFPALPSLFEEMTEKVKENFWDYDTERNIIDYGDSDIIHYTYDSEISQKPAFILK